MLRGSIKEIVDILNHLDVGGADQVPLCVYVLEGGWVRKLFGCDNLRRPVGGLLVWATEAKDSNYRGDGALAGGILKLLLDGQQHITSLNGVVRG